MFKAKYFLINTFFILLLLSWAYYAAFKYQIVCPIKAEWWIKNVYNFKDHYAKTLINPRILIVSGSNCLFGINSSVIEDITGYRVANLSVHAGLGIEFFYYKIKEHMKKGDVVVMPLEIEIFSRKKKKSDWFVNNMLAWGWEDYLSKLSVTDLFRFIVNTPEERVFEGVFKQNGKNPILETNKAVDEVKKLLASEGPKWRGYSHKSLNKYGDINVDKPPSKHLLKQCKSGISYVPINISDHFVSTYIKIRDLVKRKEGKLILTWHVSIKNKSLNLSQHEYQKRAMEFKEKLASKSIKIQCNPALFNLDVKLFFNTPYHPNKYGAMIRSENLAHCLNQLLNNTNYHDVSFNEAVSIVRNREKAMEKELFNGKDRQ